MPGVFLTYLHLLFCIVLLLVNFAQHIFHVRPDHGLEGPGLGLGLKDPGFGLGLGLEGPGLGLDLANLALTTSLV